MRKPCVLLLLTLSIAQATTLTVREDARDGRKPSYTLGLADGSGLRAWGFGANTAAPVWEVGWVTPRSLRVASHLTVLAGGYVSYWQGERSLYVEPWCLTKWQQGRWCASIKLSGYIPVTGQGWKLFSDNAEASYRLTPRWSVGLAAGDAWLVSGKKPRVGVGATTTFRTGTVSITVRALHGINEPDGVRFETSLPF